MDALLTDFISTDDFRKFEQAYNDHTKQGNLTPKIQFEYAWCLIRSRYSVDIKKGVELLEDLFNNGDEEAKRDYLFYLAVGNTKLKKYDRALQYVKAFLNVEPENRQAQQLHSYIKDRMKEDGLKGMAIVGGAALAIGGLVGLGIALAKK